MRCAPAPRRRACLPGGSARLLLPSLACSPRPRSKAGCAGLQATSTRWPVPTEKSKVKSKEKAVKAKAKTKEKTKEQAAAPKAKTAAATEKPARRPAARAGRGGGALVI